MFYRTEYSPEEWTEKTSCCVIHATCECCKRAFKVDTPIETKTSYGFIGECCGKQQATFVSKDRELNKKLKKILERL